MLRWLTIYLAVLGGVTTPAVAVTFELLESPLGTHWAHGALSDDGKVLALNTGGRYFLWSRGTGYTDLGAGHPLATNVGIAGSGRVVCGTVITAGGLRAPGLWRRGHGWSALAATTGHRPAGSDHGSGYATNSEGSTVVGLLWRDQGAVAFRWTARHGVERLPDSGRGSRATAVADHRDVIVGFDENPRTGRRRPARWRDGRLELVAGPDRAGEIMAVDRSGENCCGQLDGRAFFCNDSSGLVDLGVLGDAPWDRSGASALSDNGVVVGWSGDPAWGRREAFVWTEASGMRSLASWLDLLGIEMPEGVRLIDVFDISIDGSTIVGIWQDERWDQGAWLISGLDERGYAALPLASAKASSRPVPGDDVDLLPPPAAPKRPAILR